MMIFQYVLTFERMQQDGLRSKTIEGAYCVDCLIRTKRSHKQNGWQVYIDRRDVEKACDSCGQEGEYAARLAYPR